jgi:hypothetical protein
MKTEIAFILDRSGSMEPIRTAAMATFTRKDLALRAKKSGLATPQQLQDAKAPMSEILQEEDQKRRP